MNGNLVAVLLLGLFAGGVTCAAVQGGLLAGLITRQRAGKPTSGARRVTATATASRSERLADDLAPVGGFLAGKLVSHALLGAVLGVVGGALPLSAPVMAAVQVAAGLLVIGFGLAQLGLRSLRWLVIEPPASWGRFLRGRSRSQSALAPAILGFFSFVIPCGTTISVATLALTSGSAAAGAATMAAFVIGTVPLFTALGYLARKAATAWRGRLAGATGALILLLGIVTFDGGLKALGSPLAPSGMIRAAWSSLTAPEPADTSVVTQAAGTQEVVLTARTGEYTPGNIQLKAGAPTTLIVRSDDAQGCVRMFLIPSLGIQQVLPVTGDTRIDLGAVKPGTIDFTCGMGMYSGTLTIV